MRQLFESIRAALVSRGFNSKKKSDALSRYQQSLAEGNALLNAGQTEAAIKSYHSATHLRPDDDDALLRLGYALNQANRTQEAQHAWYACIQHNPRNTDAHYLLGEMAAYQGRNFEAAEAFRTAVKINPMMAHAYRPAATALVRSGDRKQALALLTQAIQFFPGNSDFHYYRGDLLAESGQYAQAVTAYNIALICEPNHAAALAGLGNSERHLGQTAESVNHLQQAIALEPENAAWHSDLLFTLQYSGRLDQAALFEEHIKFSHRFEKTLKNSAKKLSVSLPTPTGRLKIGYVSGDFRSHSLAFFIEPILRHHDRGNVEVHCYYTHPITDPTTERLKFLSEKWRNCADLSDSDMTALIQNDGIEVLVDLSGHTGFNRLGVFARRAAAVQMTWLGYQATTGLDNMDYRLTDGAADPIGHTEHFHTEKLIRLSSGAIFQPAVASPEVNELPALTSEIFTFGCLNNPAKMTDAFIEVAAKIITRSPNCRLLIGNIDDCERKDFLKRFTNYGVSTDNIKTVSNLPFEEYLQLHHQIDLMLDTFPYNGGTTTMHSLWMGVPVLALEGNASISRVGSETMRGLGFPEFSCATYEEYVQRAIDLSENLDFMRTVRSGLRTRFSTALVDRAKEFTTELESVFFACRNR